MLQLVQSNNNNKNLVTSEGLTVIWQDLDGLLLLYCQ